MQHAQIYITPKKDILDPQGKAIADALAALGFEGVQGVRVGKYLEVDLAIESPEQAGRVVDEMCRKLLANTIIESYRFDVK